MGTGLPPSLNVQAPLEGPLFTLPDAPSEGHRLDFYRSLRDQVGAILPDWVAKWQIQLLQDSAQLWVVPQGPIRGDDCRLLQDALTVRFEDSFGRVRLRICEDIHPAPQPADGPAPQPADPGTLALPEREAFFVGRFNRYRSGSSSVRTTTTNKARPKLSQEDLFREARRTLPVDVEPFRLLRYRLPLQNGHLDLLVAKMHVPEEKEDALRLWKESFEEQHNLTVSINRIKTVESMRSQLNNLAQGAVLLGPEHLPAIDRDIEHLCGKPPSEIRDVPRPHHGLDLTDYPFRLLDSPNVLDPEDALYAERLPSGDIRLFVAFVDVTHLIGVGSEHDRYAQRVGTTIYSPHRRISTLGNTLAEGHAAFREGVEHSAWVVQLIIAPDGSVRNLANPWMRRAMIRPIEQLDPDSPDLNSMVVDDPSLSALCEAALRLHGSRLKSKRFIRTDGDGIGRMIVAESMIAGKSAIGEWMVARKLPGIFKVHAPLSDESRAALVHELAKLEIPASPSDFNDPLQVTGILDCLENRRSKDAFSLVSQILDSVLLRSYFSTVPNQGHYAIGARNYVEPKPRDAAALAFQFQADAYERGLPGLSMEDLEARVSTRNRRNWSRDQIYYRLQVLGMLRERLGMVGQIFSAKVLSHKQDGLLLEAPGFSRWGFMPTTTIETSTAGLSSLPAGTPLQVRLEGYNRERGRFEFSLVSPFG